MIRISVETYFSLTSGLFHDVLYKKTRVLLEVWDERSYDVNLMSTFTDDKAKNKGAVMVIELWEASSSYSYTPFTLAKLAQA